MNRPQLRTILAWRWAIDNERPSIFSTLRFGEAVRSSVMDVARRRGHKLLPDYFHRSASHEQTHAYWLPEDADDDGLIDHVMVYCDAGMEPDLVSVLADVRSVRFGSQTVPLRAVWMGDETANSSFGPSQTWISQTPYITPRRRLSKTGKARADEVPERQLLGELAIIGFPMPVKIEWPDNRWTEAGVFVPTNFVVARQSGKPPPSDRFVSFVMLSFDTPIMGPIALGYGAHFGMGHMVGITLE
jgi:CRISPR-associated protein Csb2